MQLISTRPIVRRAAAVALVAAAAALTAGCSASISVGDKAVPEKEVEQQAAEQLAATVDNSITPIIDCPDDLPAEVDAKMTCELTVEGDETVLPVFITVTSVDGDNVKFDIEVGE